MRTLTLLFLFISFLLPKSLMAQLGNWSGNDTIVVVDDLKLDIKQLPFTIAQTVWYYKNKELASDVEVISNLDSMKRILPTDIKISSLQYDPNIEYWGIEDIECSNGVKILFKGFNASFEKYYPRQMILKLDMGMGMRKAFDLNTGKDAIEPIYLDYSELSDYSAYRIYLKKNDDTDDTEDVILQIKNKGKDDYDDLFKFSSLVGNECNINSAFWIDDTIFFDTDLKNWSINIVVPSKD